MIAILQMMWESKDRRGGDCILQRRISANTTSIGILSYRPSRFLGALGLVGFVETRRSQGDKRRSDIEHLYHRSGFTIFNDGTQPGDGLKLFLRRSEGASQYGGKERQKSECCVNDTRARIRRGVFNNVTQPAMT